MINKYTFIIFILLVTNIVNSQVNPNEVFVNGYTKENGTVVAPHYRTAPNSTNIDNFSTLPNINPHTLEPGYILPDSKSDNINTQIYIPDYPTYYPDQNEIKSNYSYEVERLLEKVSNQQYYNNSQKPSSEVIDNYDSYYNQNFADNNDYISAIDSSAAPVDSTLIINSSYETPKIIHNNNIIENKKNDFTNTNIQNETDITIFAEICVFFLVLLIAKKIFA